MTEIESDSMIVEVRTGMTTILFFVRIVLAVVVFVADPRFRNASSPLIRPMQRRAALELVVVASLAVSWGFEA